MKTALAALAFLSAAVVSPSVGQGDNEHSRQTLAGLSGVYVAISSMSEEDQRHGLSQTQIRTDVELKLRQTGITVLSQEEASRAPGLPYLYVTASILPLSHSLSGVYAFSILVHVVQTVRLDRNQAALVLGSTWTSDGVFGAVGESRLEEYVRNAIRDETDQFINAYLAANPKR